MTSRHVDTALLRHRGFTLIEVLVALSIFSLLALGSFRLMYSSVAAVDSVAIRSATDMQRARALTMITSDLRHIVARTFVPQSQTAATAAQRQPAVMSDTTSLVEFSRVAHAMPGQQGSGALRYRYRLSDDRTSSAGYDLLREKLNSNGYRGPSSGAQAQVLLSNVQQVEFRFRDHLGNWQRQWPKPPTQDQQDKTYFEHPDFSLPSAVEVSIATSEWSARKLITLAR